MKHNCDATCKPNKTQSVKSELICSWFHQAAKLSEVTCDRFLKRTDSLLQVILSSQISLFSVLAGRQTHSRWVSESDKDAPSLSRDVHGYASRRKPRSDCPAHRQHSVHAFIFHSLPLILFLTVCFLALMWFHFTFAFRIPEDKAAQITQYEKSLSPPPPLPLPHTLFW